MARDFDVEQTQAVEVRLVGDHGLAGEPRRDEDDQGGGTLIATRTRTNVPTAWTTYEETLTTTEADAITNYGYLEFFANQV